MLLPPLLLRCSLFQLLLLLRPLLQLMLLTILAPQLRQPLKHVTTGAAMLRCTGQLSLCIAVAATTAVTAADAAAVTAIAHVTTAAVA